MYKHNVIIVINIKNIKSKKMLFCELCWKMRHFCLQDTSTGECEMLKSAKTHFTAYLIYFWKSNSLKMMLYSY